MLDVVLITKEGPNKSCVSLKGQELPEVAPATNSVGGVMSSDTIKGVLACGISSKVAILDPRIEAFMRQPKLQFTIDCLLEEFAKFAAAGGRVTGGAAKKKRERPTSKAAAEEATGK